MSDPSNEGRHSDGELLAIERDRALWSQAAEQGMRETISRLSEENDALRKALSQPRPKLPKVREAIDILGRLAYGEPYGQEFLKRMERAALAELDKAEGKVTG